MKKWIFCIVFANMLLFMPSRMMSQPPELINLPGHMMTETEALKSSSVVTVATLKSSGQMNLGSVGMNIYSFVKLKIEQTLVGNAPDEIVAMFTYRTAPPSVAEVVPVVGEKYIIFFQRGRHNYPGQAYEILKFSSYNEAEVSKVKALINAQDAPVK